MRKVRLAGVLLLTTLVATGCGAGPQRLDGEAQPAGAASTGPAPYTQTAAPSPVAPSTATTSPASRPATGPATPTATRRTTRPPVVLGPDGFGALKLGMSRSEAEATGMISGYRIEDFGANCGISKLRGTDSTVFFTPGLGVSSIDAAPGVRTPEGIRLGSTMSAVQRAYPDWELAVGGGDTGWGWAGHYRIDVKNGKVTYLTLATEGQRCVE
jgi:hypothetical protein